MARPAGASRTLAVAIAYRAIQNGFEARFSTADELIGNLSGAAAPGQLEEALEPYVHPHVLVIDVLGYQSYAAEAANVLLPRGRHPLPEPQAHDLHHQQAPGGTGAIVADGDLAEAILESLERNRDIFWRTDSLGIFWIDPTCEPCLQTGRIMMRKWILLIPVLCAVVGSCGGNKLKNPGSSIDEILFINDTSENTYRITVVGTSADFTLRSTTRKTVKVPREGAFNVNIERTEGSGGQARMSVQAKAGDTVRIYARMLSFAEREEILVEVIES